MDNNENEYKNENDSGLLGVSVITNNNYEHKDQSGTIGGIGIAGQVPYMNDVQQFIEKYKRASTLLPNNFLMLMINQIC